MPTAPAYRLSRRTFVIAGAASPLLFGCSSDPNSDSAAIVSVMRQSVDQLIESGAVTREEAARVPFASIGLRVGGGDQDLLVLATQSKDVCLWTSAAHQALEIQSGRVIRTSGLPHDSAQTAATGNDPLQSRINSGAAYEYEIDLPDRGIYRARVRYEMKGEGRDEINILGSELDLVRYSESATCSLLDWHFHNQFWIDPENGFVWRSVQSIHPDMDSLEIVVFRPPA